MTKECELIEIEKRTIVAVYAAGKGTNFEEIVAEDSREIETVILFCDKPIAHVIEKAAHYDVENLILSPGSFPSKADYEKEILTKLERIKVEWIVLAGYMRIVGETLLEAYKNRIVNVHPSLLPSFPGKDAVGQAIDAGVKVSGVTIHF